MKRRLADPRVAITPRDLADSSDELNNLLQCSNVKKQGRTCTKCREWKTWTSFIRRQGGRNGRASCCNDCRALNAKVYRSHQSPTTLKSTSDGISLELTLVPSERFWSGFNRLLDMICDQEIQEYERQQTQEALECAQMKP